MIDIAAHAAEVRAQGFTVIPNLCTELECNAMRDILREFWIKQGSPALTGFGMPIHPLIEQIPDIAPHYIKPEPVRIMELVFEDDVRLVHTGARLAGDESDASIGWHHHCGWDVSEVVARTKISRLLGGYYVDGTTKEAGPLVVVPRSLNEPVGDTCADENGHWPGEVEVQAPPGSFTLFDTALWHSARRGSQPGHRYLFGSHFQARSCTRAHPEDNTTPGITAIPQVRDSRLLISLLES